ncbi:hypothetical protein JM18_008185 [Phytophthora kernoviae]|uniref:Homologous recombination OB-fold protein OB-fold domain-containing protein n=2 Tax=Phytophthora kernoviae TaxID=325452 RepID=A0A8T0LM25_9STRA|nr:hypothetical protein G195_009766 [Phytophthora kernoviae 00238/432]KAG2511605.1 hypothetical protein JM16_008223 [Phytophthora kernoviae]KAG2515358.1 hypothetical protein JM18_008185 [Phytophthora kernoviae]
MASANADRFTVMPATVFDQGPWVDMCQYLGMKVTPGASYGGIKVSSLKCPVQKIVEDDQAVTKVPEVTINALLVLIKSMRYVDEEIVAILHDPTGEIEGYFHRELVEQLGPGITAGTGVLLYKVSVFTPTEAPVTGRRKSYLNITPRNIRQVFVMKDQSSSAPSDSAVGLFNAEKEAEVGQDSDNDDYDDNMASTSEQAARQLLQHRNDLDARLRALQAKTAVEEGDWIEQGRKLYEFEDKFLRDTLLEGNIMTGWGEPRTAPVRFRNAGVRKRKRERQEAAAERAGKPQGPSTPTLSAKEQLKVDRHRLASYSSIESPAEPMHATLGERERKLAEVPS